MDLALAGKTVVVTGGAQGIGEAVVRTLAAEGAIPVIVDRDEKAGRLLCDALAAKGRRCELVVCDLADPGACRAAATQAVRAAGAPYGLVNNAGVNDGVALEGGSTEAFTRSLQRNLVHYFEMAQAVLPALKEAKGAIVNVASKVALTGQGGAGIAGDAVFDFGLGFAEGLGGFHFRDLEDQVAARMPVRPFPREQPTD